MLIVKCTVQLIRLIKFIISFLYTVSIRWFEIYVWMYTSIRVAIVSIVDVYELENN